MKTDIDQLSPQERLIYDEIKAHGPISQTRLIQRLENAGHPLRKRKPPSVRAVCQRLFTWKMVARSTGTYWVPTPTGRVPSQPEMQELPHDPGCQCIRCQPMTEDRT